MEAERLRVAIQIERFWPNRGGAEAYARTLASGLADEGHAVTVFALEGAEPPPKVTLTLVAAPHRPHWLRTLLYARRTDALCAPGGFDIVHAMGKSLGMNILNPHGGVEEVWLERQARSYPAGPKRLLWMAGRYLTPRHWVLRSIFRRQYRDPRVLRFVALSRASAEAMTRVHGVDPSRIRVLANSVDPSRFRPAASDEERRALRLRLGIPDDAVVLLFVGHNFRLKGLYCLMSALAATGERGTPLRVEVLGRGDIESARRTARACGVEGRMSFRGGVSTIEEWYRAADGYVHPTFFDTASLSLLEAMASGLPVIASRHDGSSEQLAFPRGGVLLDEPGDVPVFARALERMLERAWRVQAGAANRELAERVHRRDPVRAMLAIYRKALSERCSPPVAQDSGPR